MESRIVQDFVQIGKGGIAAVFPAAAGFELRFFDSATASFSGARVPLVNSSKVIMLLGNCVGIVAKPAHFEEGKPLLLFAHVALPSNESILRELGGIEAIRKNLERNVQGFYGLSKEGARQELASWNETFAKKEAYPEHAVPLLKRILGEKPEIFLIGGSIRSSGTGFRPPSVKRDVELELKKNGLAFSVSPKYGQIGLTTSPFVLMPIEQGKLRDLAGMEIEYRHERLPREFVVNRLGKREGPGFQKFQRPPKRMRRK